MYKCIIMYINKYNLSILFKIFENRIILGNSLTYLNLIFFLNN